MMLEFTLITYLLRFCDFDFRNYWLPVVVVLRLRVSLSTPIQSLPIPPIKRGDTDDMGAEVRGINAPTSRECPGVDRVLSLPCQCVSVPVLSLLGLVYLFSSSGLTSFSHRKPHFQLPPFSLAGIVTVVDGSCVREQDGESEDASIVGTNLGTDELNHQPAVS